MSEYPKFEKINGHTIKIIVERSDIVDLAQIIKNKEQLLEQKTTIEKTLKNIEEILENAQKLGIVPYKAKLLKDKTKVKK